MSPSDGCSCGYSSARRWTRCPECDARRASAPGAADVRWADHLPTERHRVPCGALGEALGGGIAPGAAVLLAGAPGAGKTTLAIDALTRLGGTMISLEMGTQTLADYARRSEAALGKQAVRWLVTDEPRIDRALLAARGMLVVLDSLAVVDVAGRPARRPGPAERCSS
jgi:DNA repair protein RadA/Sms